MQRRLEVQQELQAFDKAVTDDATASVPAAAVREFDDASRELLQATANELKHARTTIDDSRNSSDTVVSKGADLYRTMARRVQTAGCTE